MYEHEKTTQKKISARTKWNIKSWFFSMALFLILVAIILIALLVHDYIVQDAYRYVTSEYSKYCYGVGDTNPNMKVLTYFKTLKECGKPLFGTQ